MKEDLVQLIIKALPDLNGHLEGGIPAELTPDTPLYGQDGMLDSLGLVALVVAVEQAIEDAFSVSVSLADERAMSRTESPYRTIGSLAEYAGSLIQHEM
jgi:acyl carrier protein